MTWIDWLIVALAVLEAGWMAFDGTRALVVGDYVTPKEGPYAGQLGPWSRLVAAVGIAPRSTLMKAIFATYGWTWLILIALFVFTRAAWTWYAMVFAAIGTLWYLPIGTVFSMLQIVLLFFAD